MPGSVGAFVYRLLKSGQQVEGKHCNLHKYYIICNLLLLHSIVLFFVENKWLLLLVYLLLK